MRSDLWGNEVTAAGADAVARLDDAVLSYLGLRSDPGEHLKAALTADPDLVMGHVLRGCFFLLFANLDLAAQARGALEKATAAAGRAGATTRERAHIAALAAWCDGDTRGAVRRWSAILVDHPRDPVALKLSEYWNFYFGDSHGMRGAIGRILHAWDEATPGYGFVLGMKAFALEECGDYAAAEADGRRAVALNPADSWAAHAVAHVMEMTGRQRDGIDWITGLAGNWDAVNNFLFHVWWHRALFHYELGEFDAVLDLYDRDVRPESTGDYLDITNAVAMLWRLELEAVDVGPRWDELAVRAAERDDDHMLVFADAHYVMAFAATGDAEAAERMIDGMKAHAAAGEDDSAAVMTACGIALCDALGAFGSGDYGRAVDLLMPLRPHVRGIGGSHAQRDVFELTLVHAAIRDGQRALARALLSERTFVRPRSPLAWRTYAKVLADLGETDAAAGAADTSAGLIAG